MNLGRAARSSLASLALLVPLTLTLTAGSARAATGGPDAAGYRWEDVNSGCTVQSDPFMLANPANFTTDTASIGPLSLGFNFAFYDRTVSQIWLHPAGLIFFQAPPTVPLFNNQVIPLAGDGVSGFLAPYWGSMRIDGNPDVWYESFAALGYFKISYSMVPQDSWSGSMVTQYEVYLYRNGDIRIEYLSPGDGFVASIGQESFNEATGLQMRYNLSYTNGMTYGNPTPFSICISRPHNLVCTTPPTIQCGLPVNGTSPASIPANATTYTCGTGTWAGREMVYQITVPTLSDLNVALTGMGGRIMAAYLLSDCSESTCFAGGSSNFNALLVSPGTYYIVVDALAAADNGAFTLTVRCTSLSTPIACEETLGGTTAGEPNRLEGYACGGVFDWSGPDKIYEVNFVPPGNLTATVVSGTNKGVFIFNAASQLLPSLCLAGGAGRAVVYDPPAGRYLIVVDGDAASAGPFTLSLACSPVISCSPGAGSFGCRERLVGTTVGLSSFVDNYRCVGTAYDGPEAVYTFTNLTQQIVSFVLESPDPNLDVVLLDSCNEGACVEIGDTEISIDLAPGTYYVVIDGRSGAAGSYVLSSICGYGLEPATLSLTGAAGQCFDEHKIAWLTPELVRADVLFSIDTTGSMSGAINQLQNNMQQIITYLESFIPDVQYGLASYKDYSLTPNYNTPCVYGQNYGGGGDFPYNLEQPITSDRAAVQNAVNGLFASGGGDGPESYNTMLFEAANDPGIGWRAGSKRILVDFGDEMPHDCNVLQCLGDFAGPRGVDPGRDLTANTADDIDTLGAIQELIDADTVLIHFDNSGGRMEGPYTFAQIWECWGQLTGGGADALNADGTVPSSLGGIDCGSPPRADCLAELVAIRIQEQGSFCRDLYLQIEPIFMDWLVDAGVTYTDVRLPSSVTFDIRFCVPPGTPPGSYNFVVNPICGGQIVTSQSVHVDVTTNCSPSIVGLPTDATICEGGSATLDASGVTLVNCAGTVGYEWRDGLGNVVGTTARITVSPAATTTYTVTVTCSSDSLCRTTADATVDVHLPPLFSALSVRDPDACNLGLELTWGAATFRDPTGSGSYNIYSSEISCADAMTRRPVANVAAPALRWVDPLTRAGRTYYYVVEAEDARLGTACPRGPTNGGAVNTNRVCFGPVTESPDAYTPNGPGWTLRARHVVDLVTMDWTGSPALLAGEHYHVLKGYDETSFAMVNAEGQLPVTWTETDTSRWLQFFDIRVANTCEIQSLDDEPAPWDQPR